MGSGWTKLMAAGIAVAAASCSSLLGIASSPASVPARGDSVVVSDRESLMRAIDRAQPGSTILLAPADYGAVTIRRASFERPIKLKSLRPTQPARFTAIKKIGRASCRERVGTYVYIPGGAGPLNKTQQKH